MVAATTRDCKQYRCPNEVEPGNAIDVGDVVLVKNLRVIYKAHVMELELAAGQLNSECISRSDFERIIL